MSFINWIIEACNDASDFFYEIYLEVYGWIYPFWLAATFFYSLCLIFNDLAWDFYYFGNWVNDVANKITQILSYANIAAYFRKWFDWAEDAWDWVTNAYSNIVSNVTTWWDASNNPIRLFIKAADQAISNTLSILSAAFNNLKVAWDNFWTVIFPQWIASLQNLWNSFTAFVASIGQTILEYLQAFWNSTIFPAFQSIWQFLSALHIPTWDEIWSFVFSKLPGIDDILNWWAEFWLDVKTFFTEPLIWLWQHALPVAIINQITEIIEAAGGTEAERDEEYKKVPPVNIDIDDTAKMLKDETLYIAHETWGLIEPEIEKIRAKIKSEVG